MNRIEISSLIRRGVSPSDLLKPKGKLTLFPQDIVKANLFKTTGYFFIVEGEGFYFRLSIDETGLYVERNGESCVLTPNKLPEGRLKCFVMTWSPTRLRLISAGPNGKDILSVTYTTPCSAPLSLKRWARDKSLIQTKFYESEADFRDAVYQCFSDLQTKIEDNGSGESFWDYLYEGNKIKDKLPKKETLIQPLIKTILDTELYLRGIDVFRENTTIAGDIDFTVVGSVNGVGVVNMCIELKNAHSKYLENGLLNQLPDYMRSQKSEFGAYCILNYNIDKGGNIKRAELLQKLIELQLKSNDDIVQTKIRIFVIDLDNDVVLRKRK